MSNTEEIKKRLDVCTGLYGRMSGKTFCFSTMGDAIAYIEHLEAENASLKKQLQSIVYCRDCKYYKEPSGEFESKYCDLLYAECDEDDHCKNAKRREDKK